MFPVANPDVYFPQFYKRYGSSTALKCKGDGATAVCGTEEFAKGLEKIRTDEMGLPIVKCQGKECLYYKKKECSEVGVLQILLPELPGAGVWQISTGSFNSIVNLNSCIDYIIAVCGRAHMIPLQLERRVQETTHEGKKANHFILHINMDFRLADLQKYALIEPTRMMLELPAPEDDKADILFAENVEVNGTPALPTPESTTKTEQNAALICMSTIEKIAYKDDEKGRRYGIQDGNNFWYSTYSETLTDLANTAKTSGEIVALHYNETESGRALVNIESIKKAA